MPIAWALVLSSGMVHGAEGQAVHTLPDSGTLVRLHTANGIARGRMLAPFRSDAATVRFCAYPGPPCDANTPADRLLEMRTDAIRSLELSVGTRWRKGAVIGGLIGAGLGVRALGCEVQPLPAQFARSDRVGLSQPAHMAERGSQRFAMPSDVDGSYWKEGGVVTAIAGVILANALPSNPSLSDRISGSILGALVFFWPGALIGKQFPKD